MFKEKIFAMNNGFEFRTIFNEESIDIISKLEKMGFKITNKGEKGLI